MRPGRHNAITDVAGISVGQHQRLGDGWATGVTAVLAAGGAVGGVDVRGGGPATRETGLLDPSALVQRIDAVLLCGGSAYGLAAADGAMRWLAERGRGFAVGARPHEVVPIVPAAALFDLRSGAWGNVPDATFGYAACDAAGPGALAQGSAGAGTGAVAGRIKGGVGTASVLLGDGCTVGALAAVNPFGDTVDVGSGLPWAASLELAGEFGLNRPDPAEVAAAAALLGRRPDTAFNTVIGVVATDATLDKAQCRRLAMTAHDGLARAVRPAHSLFDGDTVFAMATGARPAPTDPPTHNALAAAAADTFARAIVHAVLAVPVSGWVPGVPSYRELWPSALG